MRSKERTYAAAIQVDLTALLAERVVHPSQLHGVLQTTGQRRSGRGARQGFCEFSDTPLH